MLRNRMLRVLHSGAERRNGRWHSKINSTVVVVVVVVYRMQAPGGKMAGAQESGLRTEQLCL